MARNMTSQVKVLQFLSKVVPFPVDGNDAAVLDFSKAFDKVLHQRLLMKLERYGIHGNLLSWMEFFSLRGSKLSSVRVQHLPLPR